MQNDCMALGFRTVCLLLDGEILFLVFEMREIEYNFKIFICLCSTTTTLYRKENV